MIQILDAVKESITPELLSEAAKIYGENEIGISKTIGSLAPTILLGLLEKSGDSHSIYNIFNSLRDFDPAILGKLNGLLTGASHGTPSSKGATDQFLEAIFGAKIPALTNAVASFSGVKQSSAAGLLGLATPLVMGLLSKKINTEGLNTSSLVSYLLSQKTTFLSLVPSSVGSLLGVGNMSGGSFARGESAKVGLGWLWPLLMLVALGVAVMYYMKSCNAKPEIVEMPKVEAAPVPPPPVIHAPPPVPKFTLKLSTGYEVVGSINGMESRLLTFIQDPETKAGKDNWFDFDHLLFETANDQLNVDSSKVQLSNVVEILHAYPSLKIKIGGYTDNLGDIAKNKALSARRANNVMAELVKRGIPASRMEAEGYGPEHPVSENATEAGRAKNRRVSVSVRAK